MAHQAEPKRALVAGISALLLAVVACIIGCGYLFIWKPFDAKRRQESVVQRLSGEATWLGSDVDELVTSTGGLDQALVLLNDLPKLHRLSLEFAGVTDRGLSHLVDCSNLEELTLGRARHLTENLDLVEYLHGTWEGKDLNTPEGIALVHQRIGEGLLVLRNADITSEGMRHVARVRTLRVLSLNNTGVGNDGMKYLAALPHLEELDLRLTRVSDEGIRDLEEFSALRKLDIGNNRYITDGSLRSVGKISSLVELRPPYHLSDEALPHLYGLTNLRVLDLRDSEYSQAALEALQRQLPKCEILR